MHAVAALEVNASKCFCFVFQSPKPERGAAARCSTNHPAPLMTGRAGGKFHYAEPILIMVIKCWRTYIPMLTAFEIDKNLTRR
jgi:hypothetical protein